MLLVKTKLAPSAINGIGLFAAEFIAAGTIIWRYNPVVDSKLTAAQIEQLPAPSQAQISKYSYREIRSGLYVLCGDDARFFNHANEPNCIDLVNEAKGDVTLAGRDIAEDEELTCNYTTFDLDLIEGKYAL
jgi:uncharacterized protein